MIDSRWNESSTPVHEVALEEDYSDILQPAGGQYVSGDVPPISARRMPKGNFRESTEVEWHIKQDPDRAPNVIFDSNFYRSALHRGLATESGNPGSITFFGKVANKTLAEHFGAKLMKLKEGNRRAVEVWTNKPGRDQDHWLDCAVMNRVALELLGFRTSEIQSRQFSNRVSQEQLQKARERAQRQRR